MLNSVVVFFAIWSLILILIVVVILKSKRIVKLFIFIALLLYMAISMALFIPRVQKMPDDRIRKATRQQAEILQREFLNYQSEHGAKAFPSSLGELIESSQLNKNYYVGNYRYFKPTNDNWKTAYTPVFVQNNPKKSGRWVIDASGGLMWFGYGAYKTNMENAGLPVQ